jgi:hypothetical protein
MQDVCPAFADEIELPMWATRDTLLFANQTREDPRLYPYLFIESDGARAVSVSASLVHCATVFL